jgi:hexosaminidase
MRLLYLLAVVCLLVMPLVAQSQQQISTMPLPASFRLGTGQFVIDQAFSVSLAGYKDERTEKGIERFLQQLSRQTGMPLVNKHGESSPAGLTIHAEHGSNEVQELGEDESYDLQITPSGARLSAPNPLGVLHGLQTFLQLVETGSAGFAVPEITIQDRARFAWRGLLMDVARHFIPLDVLKRNLDGMAAVKMNVFHWHLSDNQGFRVESKKFPKLQELGSDGLYYTQNEVREVIAYARDRGIRVVPEFDMPGHSTSWFVGYPELASAPGPYRIERKWGVFDPAMDPTQDRTYKFLDGFIGEMARLFPDEYFHIGGDEVNGKQWDANPKIREFMRSHGMKSNQDLQAYFNKRLQAIVSKHKKTMIGWDEILNPDLPKTITIQSWRGQESLAQAAKLGYRGLLSNGYYVDLMWPAKQHYAIDPMADAAAGLNTEGKQRILGGEACMWSEYVSPENIDSRIWPRTAAIAERLWSPENVRDVNSMYQRLEIVSRHLDWLGLTHNSNYWPMLRRIAATDDISALRTLADVVEPVKDYTREETAPSVPTSSTPLNRLVDAARPESQTARRFADLVNALISQQSNSNETKAEIRSLLTAWRDNPKRLQAAVGSSFLLKEVVPISQELSALGAAGLRALDYFENGQTPPEPWEAEQLALVEQAKKPQAQVLLMVAPAVQALIEASGATHSSSSSKRPVHPMSAARRTKR